MRSHSAVLALVLLGCPGDDSSPTTDASSGASTSTSTSASDASSTSMDSATSMNTTAVGSSDGADSSSGGPLCPAFEDDTSPGPVTIDIVNMRPDEIWVPLLVDCIESVPYEIIGPDGAPVVWRGAVCGTCAGAVQGDCPCPPPFCDEYFGLFLEPGASFQYSWSGLTYVDETVPQACPGIAECGQMCQRAVLPADGTYTFEIQAGRASGCATEPCDCMPMGGSCLLTDPGVTFGMLTQHSGTLQLPGESMVQITID